MKKRYIIMGILICIIAFLGYLQYGHEEQAVNTMVSTSDAFYKQEFDVIANKLFIFDKEKYAEELIEQAAASHVKKVLIMPQANLGNLFVTNQRVVFRPTQGRPSSQFEYELSDLRSFSVGMASTITLHTKSVEEHKITGMFNKKLISALEKAGLAQE